MLLNVQEKFESIVKKREALLQHIDSLSSEILSFKADSDKWSIVEVIEHLVMVEENLIKQLSANVPASTLDPESRSPEKHQTVIKVMERDIQVDVPHESMEPHGRLTLDELLNRWDGFRKKLHELLVEIDAEKKDDLVYQHPYGGPLDISDTLQFIEAHFDNHMRHIDRILTQTKR